MNNLTLPQIYREEREAWIRAKYEKKEFLADLPSSEMSVAEVSINLYRCYIRTYIYTYNTTKSKVWIKLIQYYDWLAEPKTD